MIAEDSSMPLQIKTADALSKRRPKIVWLAGLPVPVSVVGIISAWGGKGKTLLSINMAYDYLKLHPHKKAMLWLTEDPEGEIWHRVAAIKAWHKSKGINYTVDPEFVVSPPIKFTRKTKVGTMLTEEFVKAREVMAKYDMIVLDPLLNFNGGRESDNEDARAFMEPLSRLAREYNKVIVLLHHSSKALEGETTVRGASDFINASRYVYNIDVNDTTGVRRVALIKSNMGLDKHWASIKEYKRHDFIPPDEFWPDTEEPESVDTVTVSYSAQNADGFKSVSLTMDKLADLLKSKFNYSPTTYTGEYRNIENAQEGQTAVVLDFDDGMTLEDAKVKFGGIKSIIATTRNHQKEKNGIVCDRFRVVMPCRPMTLCSASYAELMVTVIDVFGSDPSCKDISRMYYGNPDAEIWMSEGTELFDWEEYWHMAQARLREIAEKHTYVMQSRDYTPEERNAVYESEFIENYATYSRNITINQMLWKMRVIDGLPEDEVVHLIKSLNDRSRELTGIAPLDSEEMRYLLRTRNYMNLNGEMK